MNQQDVTAIVEKLKERARAHPWIPVGLVPPEHFHKFPDGLSICFTLDILPGAQYWHLSIARPNGSLRAEEIEFWRAFFDEEPTIELPSQICGLSSRHFHWRMKDGTREG